MATATKTNKRDSTNLDRLFEQVPAEIEAEMVVLGSMLLDPSVIGSVLEVIGPAGEDFTQQRHAAIYRVLVEHYDKGRPIELAATHAALRRLGIDDDCGGPDYLIRLAEGVASPASGPYYARLVRDAGTRRRLIEAGLSIARGAADSSTRDIGEQLDAAEAAVFRIAIQRERHDAAQTIGDALQDAYERLEQQEGSGMTGLATGFYDLDARLHGLHRGDLVLLAARPSVGKTALSLNIAQHVAAAGRRVVLFSMEMSREQIGMRLMASMAGVDAQRIRRNQLSEDEYRRLQSAVAAAVDSAMLIDDTPGLTPLALRAKARRLAAKGGLDLVVLDYLQLMSESGRRESRQVEVAAISRALKALARELNVPVLCLSQLNRKPEDRTNQRPRMSDLRESGAQEQDADVVLMLHREDYAHRGEDGYEPTHEAEVIIEKQRQGPTGSVRLAWNSDTMTFHNLERRTIEPW